MMLHLALVLEIMAVIVCIHRLYGQKVKLDIGTVGLYFACLLLFEAINIYGLKGFWALGAYVLIGVYCIRRQKESVMGAALSIALMIIIIAVMQFMFALPLHVFWAVNESIRVLVVNLSVLGCCIWFIPKGKLATLRMVIMRLEGHIFLLIGFGLCIILFMLFQEKIYRELRLEMFIFVIPAVIVVYRLVVKWDVAQRGKKEAEKELQITMTMQDKYEELVTSVRMHQHEFKNHLAAILSAHYTYKSYDKLVEAQNAYSDRIMQINRHNILLALGNNILAGFLYGKFQELEAEGISIDCQIKGAFQHLTVPAHYMVEMVGILLDNASQAVHDSDAADAVISYCMLESEESYQFVIRNRFPYTAYSEIEEWFQIGNSTKGEGRGIGLYYVKKLCEELACEICCRNVEIDGENWIEFGLKIGKADR